MLGQQVAHVSRSTKAGTRAPATPGEPEHEQHAPADRSTKAGTRAPATLLRSGSPGCAVGRHAQRRPGPAPRRHPRREHDPSAVPPRSTKAGTRAPATRDGVAVGRLHADHRSTKAGTRAPATPPGAGNASGCSCRTAQRRPGPAPRRHAACRAPSRRTRALNEGRDPRPGDTLDAPCPAARFAGRSTKAGTRAPATPNLESDPILDGMDAQRRPGPAPRRHAWSIRDLHPHDSAQRRPGPAPRRHPATRRRPTSPAPLNEGRDPRPGDTWSTMGELQPGDQRSTKAGTRAPATLVGGPAVVRRVDRSTKAGTRAPATRGIPFTP